MGLKDAREARRRRRKRELAETGFWPGLCSRIDEGRLIPFIGESVAIDMLFDIDEDGILGVSANRGYDQDNAHLTIREQLAQSYAYWSDCPLAENHRLARVALFNSVVNKVDKLAAKQEYINWLKGELLFQAEEDPDVDPDTIAELQEELDKPLSYIAGRLGYPQPVDNRRDSLDLLAKLRLPIYITTDYFDFLEQALIANRVTPRTQVCFWNGSPSTYEDETHRTDHQARPSADSPIVYHLFGYEAYPGSLVLTEDDYLDFLAKLAADAGQKEPVLPHYLRERLTLSSLVLLGYRPGDWDFRVMFRGLIAAASNIEMLNLAIQFDPAQEPAAVSGEEIRKYLQNYFKPVFEVEWDTAHGFAGKLYDAWDERRR